jgi:predicted nucleic acid-binding protein
MTTLLLDASVILAAFDSDDALHQHARDLLLDPDVSLATLDLARYEIVNVAIRAWRAPDTVPALLAAVDRIADDGGIVASNTELLTRTSAIAEHHGISAYDAAYVAAAETGNWRLVSCDERDLVSRDLATHPAKTTATPSPRSSERSENQ